MEEENERKGEIANKEKMSIMRKMRAWKKVRIKEEKH